MKVGIYCRLSEEDRNKVNKYDDSESIQNQKLMLTQYANEKNWEIYHVYSDDDYAGADRNRPQFKQLIGDAENHKFDIVLCKSQSRFTREVELTEYYLRHKFLEWNIRFVSIVDNVDTDALDNIKTMQILSLVNEWYIMDLSDNIKSVLTNRRRNGFHIGAFALYGYKKDPNQKGHLIIDDEAADVVREIFVMFTKGYGKTAIARMLNERGIPNPTEYKRLKGLRYQQAKEKNSTLWKYYAISDMLTNEIYIGNMIQGRYGSISYKTKKNKPLPKEQWIRCENTHDAIIDRDLWERVQKLVAQKAKPCYTGEVGLFANKARCMNCHYTMRSSKNRGKHYLRCTTHHVAVNACIGSFISVDTLEMAVLNELHKMMEEYLDKDKLERKVIIEEQINSRIEKLKKESVTIAKNLDETKRAKKELYKDKIKGIISENEFIEFSEDFTLESERYQKLMVQNEKNIGILNDRLLESDTRRQKVEEYIKVKNLNREIVEKLINCIYIGKKDGETKQIPIEVHWNF